MCGIVGAASTRDVVGVLIEGIKKLEYRGYDSAGIAFLKDGHLERLRSTGRVAHLEEVARKGKTEASTGLSHTRWATHGAPSEANAHPHFSAGGGLEIAVVHNGIVENYEAIRAGLSRLGYSFSSETDTEVLAHHVHSLVTAKGLNLFDAVMEASREWEGAYAAGFISSREPDTVVGARKGSPLLVGLGQGENFLASDASALISRTRQVVYLLEGDIVEVQPERVRIRDGEGRFVDRSPTISRLSQESVERGPYAHYMQKEIFEQPGALGNTLEMVLNAHSLQPNLFGADAEAVFGRVNQVLLLACGTSYHAGLVARYWLEAIAGLPASVEIASEYRYRDPVTTPGTLVVTISQSGETADTLAALQHAKLGGLADALSVCNVPESALLRNSNLRFLTRAGPEIGVASTKAFTTQLAALFVLTLVFAKLRRRLSPARERDLIAQLRHLPAAMEAVLSVEPKVQGLGAAFPGQAARALPRPRRPFSDRDGRGAQAEGDLLRARGSLCRRGIEARPARPGGFRDAGGDGGPQRPVAGEAQVQHAGSARARRRAVRGRGPGRPGCRERGRARDTPGRPRRPALPHPARDPAAAPRLPRRALARHRRGQAP